VQAKILALLGSSTSSATTASNNAVVDVVPVTNATSQLRRLPAVTLQVARSAEADLNDSGTSGNAVFTVDNVRLLNEQAYFVQEAFVCHDDVAAARRDADRLFEQGHLRAAKIEEVWRCSW
jgi:hypothetical protein